MEEERPGRGNGQRGEGQWGESNVYNYCFFKEESQSEQDLEAVPLYWP
jgi:hypothetical protein